MALRGLREYEIEQLRRIDETWSVSPLVLAAVSRCVELHDEARGLRSLLQEGRVPAELAERLQQEKQERGELLLTEVLRLTIEWLFLDTAPEAGTIPAAVGVEPQGKAAQIENT